jgi:GntR family transcriptional regulator/MocR family aminotransferase
MVQSGPAAKPAAKRIGAQEIYAALKEQISGGVFGAAGKLPSSRGLAQELGVSRTTVTVAFEQLHAEGFIELRQGARPTVVRAAVAGAAGGGPGRARPAPAPGEARLSAYGARLRGFSPWSADDAGALAVDFRHGDLSSVDFPSSAWRKALAAAAARRPGRLAYGDPRGSARLRSALQGYLWRARTIRCDLDQIVVVNGSQQGLDLCARVLLDPGDRFVIENPCYDMARQIFAGAGALPVPVAVDRQGMDTGRLAHVQARLAYVTPSHQFPLGGVMPVARRHQLLDWARRSGAHIVEDDYDSEFRYDINPVPPLFGLEAAGGVIYSGTVSKTLSPGLRLGYLVVPAGLQDVFARAKLLADRHAPLLQQEALAHLIESGLYEGHLRRLRRLNHERRASLLAALGHRLGTRIEVEGADAGLHVVVWLNGIGRAQEAALVAQARAGGIGLYPISSLYDPDVPAGLPDRAGLVLGYGALAPRDIERGVQLLGAAVEAIAGGRS